MNRKQAQQKLSAMVTKPSLLNHSYAVGMVMEMAARKYGTETDDAAQWAIAGLLHDADYEMFPSEHPKVIVDWLRQQGEDELAYAISAHWSKWGVPFRSQLDRSLLACDELTGFVVACAMIRPDGIHTLDAKSVMKKLKNPRFAANVERDEIAFGARQLNVTLDEHIQFVIEVLKLHAVDLGIDGAK